MSGTEEFPSLLVEKVAEPLPRTIALGADQARAYIIHVVKNEKIRGEKQDFEPGLLCKVHRKILFYLPKWAGELRTEDEVRIAGRKVVRTSELPDKVYFFERWLENETNKLREKPEDLENALRIATAVHFGITGELHPFNDGNGRVARIIMNGILMISHRECLAHNICLLPVPVLREHINEEMIKKLLLAGKEPKLIPYLQALENVGNTWDLNPLKLHIASRWEKSLGSFLEGLKQKYAKFHKKNWKDNLNKTERQIVSDMEQKFAWLREYATVKHNSDPVPDYFSTHLLG